MENTTTTATSPRFLTVAGVAELTSLSERTIRRAVDEGSLKAHKVRGRILILEADAVAWVQAHPLAGSAAAPVTVQVQTGGDRRW